MTADLAEPTKTLRVLFLAAEAEPWVKVGGLGDITGALPPALRALPSDATDGYQMDVRLVLPYHDEIRKKIPPAKPLTELSIQRCDQQLTGAAYLDENSGQPAYLIDGAIFQSGLPVYSSDHRQSAEQYIYFSLAALEMIRRLGWQPHVVHANDWHTAAAVYWLFLNHSCAHFWKKTSTVFCLHNLPYMGYDAEDTLASYGLPPASDPHLPEWARRLPLPLGLLGADQIIAVSPTYAGEILTPAFGCGLQDFLKTRSTRISGILNGLDTLSWNPETDPAIEARYSLINLEERAANKQALQRELGLAVEADLPLLGLVSRLDPQKGVDLVVEALRQIADLRWQAVLLGAGDKLIEQALRELEQEIPGRIRTILTFDARLARRIYAGADILMMPSRYEPCGLAQMIAMRYGCVPVGRATGGLKDTIIDDPDPKRSTGILFKEPDVWDLVSALRRAMALYPKSAIWPAIQINGMRQDFSWRRSAQAYASLYLKLLEERNSGPEVA